MRRRINFLEGVWMNEPSYKIIKNNHLIVSSEPYTDLWNMGDSSSAKTNAPMCFVESDDDYTIEVKIEFKMKNRYDQCGLVVFVNEDCWFKLCVEYMDDVMTRIISVVTHDGYADWSSTTISSQLNVIYFRLNHFDHKFVAESSFNGIQYKHIRGFHLNPKGHPMKTGVFVASAMDSSFDAKFSEFVISKNQWSEYRGQKK